jgi:hypothetical protein
MKIPIDSSPYNTLNLQKMAVSDVEAVFYLGGHEHLRDPTPLISFVPASMTWSTLLASLRQTKQEVM